MFLLSPYASGTAVSHHRPAAAALVPNATTADAL
jgi:hypothetical protein